MKGRDLDYYGPEYLLRRLIERRAIKSMGENAYKVDRGVSGNKTWGVIDYLRKKTQYIFI